MSTSFLARCTCNNLPSLPALVRASSSSASRPAAAAPRPRPRRLEDLEADRPRRGPRPGGDLWHQNRSGPPRSNNGEWRARSPSGGAAKKAYVDEPTLSLRPRIGSALREWERLGPEERRREDLARERLVREQMGGSYNKLYAMERERERLYNAHLDKRSPAERERLEKSARNVVPKTPAPFRSAGAGVETGAGLDRPKWKRGERDRQAGKGTSPFARTPRDGPPAMVPGRVNRNTLAESVDRNVVQPVVRGGAPRGTGQPKRKARPKVLKKVTLPSTVRLENLTNLLGVKLWHLQKAMERIGLENTRPERLLTAEDASLIALELNFDPTIDDEAAFDLYPLPAHAEGADLPPRPPITGIFGHVDHGKTSLLDALRSTSVAAGEAGGITQHIGAFEVEVEKMVANLRAKTKGGKAPAATASASGSSSTITFLDTPGHAAFTAMRSRGAGVTDVVVLVVAADDGVKPQTEEVINLVKGADVGVVVALTKCDKPGIDTLKVKQSLMSLGVEIEDFGGDVPCVEVSSVTGQGLPELLETISAIAEFRELKAERDGRVEGRVIESRVEKGRGNVATVLVLRGCLRATASLAAGTTWCRVRSLVPPSGKPLKMAYPGQPVEVTGWKDLPSAGDLVLEAPTEDDAKKAITNRLRRIEQEKLWEDVEIINEKRRVEAEQELVRKEEERSARERGLKGGQIAQAGAAAVESMDGSAGVAGEVKELLLIVKADVSGTVEAVVGALEGIGNKEAKVKIISSAVGDVQESDVEMARAVQASIVAFNVKAPSSVLKAAAKPPHPVAVHVSPIIYRLVDIIRAATADLLPKNIETRVHGEALVQQLFEITVKGKKETKKVAGCKVSNGVFQKARKARVVRNGEVLHTGTVSTLKQVKKDVPEITKGVECGIALDDWDAFEPDDVVQSIEEIAVSRTL